jgi:alkanesulfonate monooxygenase SsuD/methylene tetrahydromethanopterin reductase-like flavin-dependent oxidoreductase (luciferase family)
MAGHRGIFAVGTTSLSGLHRWLWTEGPRCCGQGGGWCFDCHRDGTLSRRRIGAILSFMAAGYILQGDLAARGVPAELHNAVVQLKRRYSTRPSDADAALVEELGLFDYLARRFAVYGTPEECRAQMAAAQSAGLRRVMFTVSLAADPVATVELFGSEVLPALR